MGPKPAPTTYVIPRPEPGRDLPAFASRYKASDSRGEDDQDGRSWTAAPFVEVELPIQIAGKILEKLRKYVQKDEREIVREWAVKTYGSIEAAREPLLIGAQVSEDVSVWRGLLAETKNAQDFAALSDDQIEAAMSKEAKGSDLRPRRAALLVAQRHWVDQTVKAIKESAPKGVDKDTLDRRLRAGLRGFHTAANSGKHTNPQFPYLTPKEAKVPLESVVNQVLEFLDDADDQRYVQVHRVSHLQKELGKARPRKRLELQRPKWAGRPTVQGTISKRRDAALVWDTSKKENGLCLALPLGGLQKIDVERFIYQDGTSLLSDCQIASKTSKKGAACALMPLKPKHDFLRWYTKHVENHNADAPLERRCLHNTTQFVIVDPEGQRPRLFIRPVFKFYDPGKAVPNTHETWKKPDCRYLVGIDRGINYVLRAVVVDIEKKEVIADIHLQGDKHKWRMIRDEIAYHQQMRDLASNTGKHPSVVARHVRALALARKKDRALGRFTTVKAVADIVMQCENDYGSGNYCFVLEDLDMGKMNLKRNNRVKHMAVMKEALVNQMRKRGYAYDGRRGRADGVRYEGAWYTSQVSPFGWWAKREEVEEAWKKDTSRPIGRKVGNWYEMPDPNEEGKRSDVYRKGCWKKPQNASGKPYGRNRFCVEPGDEKPDAQRRFSWGSELFWDPNVKSFKGKEFPEGVVLDADFVGALNIALRPLVNDGQGRGFTADKMAEAHTRLNPQFEIVCKIPVYEFIEEHGDKRAKLRRIVL
ncbi:MAG: hypothetical protein EDM74_12215 [Armatimonadetes bacterium]|nr:MAG: hypothetical protein EDM74_12215 [Armatimonadota bacterium]